MSISLLTRASIEKGEELRGKKIGISRLGAVPHLAIQLILDRFAIKDATILQMGGQPEAAAALRRGSSTAPWFRRHYRFTGQRGISRVDRHAGVPEAGNQFYFAGHRRAPVFCREEPRRTVRLIKGTMEGVKTMWANESLAEKDTRQIHAPMRRRIARPHLQSTRWQPLTAIRPHRKIPLFRQRG